MHKNLPKLAMIINVQSACIRCDGVLRDLNDIFYRYPFVVPEYFALITRVGSYLGDSQDGMTCWRP